MQRRAFYVSITRVSITPITEPAAQCGVAVSTCPKSLRLVDKHRPPRRCGHRNVSARFLATSTVYVHHVDTVLGRPLPPHRRRGRHVPCCAAIRFYLSAVITPVTGMADSPQHSFVYELRVRDRYRGEHLSDGIPNGIGSLSRCMSVYRSGHRR